MKFNRLAAANFKNDPRLLVVGSANTDMAIKLDRMPRSGETIIGGAFSMAAGGKGANQAVAAARAGGRVTLIARLGDDLFGKNAIAGYVREGINVKHVLRDKTRPSGVALIFVAQNGQNSIAVASGANAALDSADLRRAKKAFAGAGIVLLQLETPLKTVCTAVELAAAAGSRVILNPAPAQPLPDSLLRRLFLLTPNEHEAEMLTGFRVQNAATAVQAAQLLLARGVRNVIITLGRRGAVLANNEGCERLRAYKVKALDATAAGDVFNGALAVALAEGRALIDASRFANAAAAISVTRPGAQPSAPTRSEIEALLATGRVPRA